MVATWITATTVSRIPKARKGGVIKINSSVSVWCVYLEQRNHQSFRGKHTKGGSGGRASHQLKSYMYLSASSSRSSGFIQWPLLGTLCTSA